MNTETRAIVVALTAMLLLAMGFISPATAASDATIVVQPSETTIDADETATFEVILDPANQGVGAGELAVGVDDESVATIVDAQIGGSPNFSDISWESDNSSADVKYALAETVDSGEVTVITVTVQAESPGSTSLSVMETADNDDIKLFTEQGERYEITSATSTTLFVEEENEDESSSGSGGDSSSSSSSGSTGAGDDESAETSSSDNETEDGEYSDDQTQKEATTEGADDGDSTTETRTTESETETVETASQAPADATQEDLPGFGLLAGLTALLLFAFILARRS